VHGIIFDPPGKRVFVVCHGKEAVVGNIDTGRLIQMPNEHEKEPIYDVAISPDNRLVATTGWDQSVIVWAFAPGEEPHRLTTIAGQRITCWSVAFSPDGRRLAVGMANGQIYLWDFQHNIRVGVLRGHKQPVWALGFNPDDDSLVSVSADELRVWRVAAKD
jgi:WD40 repeat protein